MARLSRAIFARRCVIGAMLVLGVAAIAGAACAQEERVTIPTRPGVSELVLVTPSATTPVASVILFTGGDGVLFARDGAGHLNLKGGNFLIRSRQKFAAAGFLVASVDVPSDQPNGIAGFRTTEEHAQDIAAIIAYLRGRTRGPVWLIGTSMGTISASSVAARLKSGGPDGLVLTSSIVMQTRMIAPLQAVVAVDQIAVPVLFVHNKDDACLLTPFSAVAPVMERFSHAPRKELIAVSGGDPPRSDPCEAFSRHGYIGIEDQVVDSIARWIKGG